MNNDNNWTRVIGSKAIIDFSFKELLQYKDLIFLIIRRDFVAHYKQTILGPFWYIIQPLCSTIVFTIVFGNIAKISTDSIPKPLFYMSGILIWTYFTHCLSSTSQIFLNNAGIFGKVYFPRLVVPISTVISGLYKFAVQLLMFICLYFYFFFFTDQINPNLWLLLFPFLVLEAALLGLGIGIVISSLTTKYRDLAFLVGFGLQLWMYATPIVYPLSIIPEKWKWIISLNPMAPIIETFKYGLYSQGTLNLTYLGIGTLVTMVILTIGIMLFSKVEKSFMDRI